jgi:hypothetical protein
MKFSIWLYTNIYFILLHVYLPWSELCNRLELNLLIVFEKGYCSENLWINNNFVLIKLSIFIWNIFSLFLYSGKYKGEHFYSVCSNPTLDLLSQSLYSPEWGAVKGKFVPVL